MSKGNEPPEDERWLAKPVNGQLGGPAHSRQEEASRKEGAHNRVTSELLTGDARGEPSPEGEQEEKEIVDEIEAYPPIADYALLSDCQSVALVSRDGSVDWCCLPRVDHGSVFGRLLDWKKGGFCSIEPQDGASNTFRRYLDDTLVLETLFQTEGGEARLLDCFVINVKDEQAPYHQLLRIVEGTRGHVKLRLQVVPRFDYGDVSPWLRYHGRRVYSATGGDYALVLSGDPELVASGDHDLEAAFSVRAGERVRVSIRYVQPHLLDMEPPRPFEPSEVDSRLEETLDWWRRWSSQASLEGPDAPGVVRSSLVLKALTNAITGAIAAAATTSLPESFGGDRNWDYRYSWVRDSFFSVRSLTDVGFEFEADEFRRFIQRSAAGRAKDLHIMYGVGSERRLTEVILHRLEGYRSARPVRVGNGASEQQQLDVYGSLVELSWQWHLRGNSPDDDYWRFLLDLIDMAAERWREPDRGIWEIRGEPQHFVHSKVMCWSALNRGIALSQRCMRWAPMERWKKVRDEIRDAVEGEGYDQERGVFVQAFGSKVLDAALLLLPSFDFVAHEDERMIRTVDAIREELDQDGLLLRYRPSRELDGLEGDEGAFLACSFWLAECLARQGRIGEARAVFDEAHATSNDLGLFSEEYDTKMGEMLGNFPQGLTHLSHIAAAVALAEQHAEEMEPKR
jgi:GH15 family glucan-1,4-alpha-glucosidase